MKGMLLAVIAWGGYSSSESFWTRD